MQAFRSQYVHPGTSRTEELNISTAATDETGRVDNVEDVKQPVRKMRTGGRPAPIHQTTRVSGLRRSHNRVQSCPRYNS